LHLPAFLKSFCFAILTVLLVAAGSAVAQPTFIKTFSGIPFGQNLKVVPAADNGWVVFDPDSMKLMKFSSCGLPEWANSYRVANPGPNYGLSDIAPLPGGGFAFMTKVEDHPRQSFIITRINANGVVLWNKLFAIQDFRQFPYTLTLDLNGNLVLFGNAEQISSNTTRSYLCKLDGSGNVIWSRMYDLGAIWGGAIVTSDNGILARSGNRLFKTDQNGVIQWSTNLNSLNSNYYFAAVEVADGYVFSTTVGSSTVIRFTKLSKQGQAMWGGSKVTTLSGTPPYLNASGSSKLTGVFNTGWAGKFYPTVLEFDQDLQVLRQTSLNEPHPGLSLFATDHCFTNNKSAVVAGLAYGGAASELFIGKLDHLLRSSCDTVSQTISTTLEPVIQQPLPLNELPMSFTVSNLQPVVLPFTLQSMDQCRSLLMLNVGPDTQFCGNSTLSLKNNTGHVFEKYEWSTGATTDSIRISQPGLYWLRGIYNCHQDTLTDSITVVQAPFQAPNLPADTILCEEKAVVLNVRVPGATYRWQNGSTAPEIAVTDTGQYSVDVTIGNCTQRFSTHVSVCELLQMPNVITPNNDGLNDNLEPAHIRGISTAGLQVFNRWGQQVFSTGNLLEGGWNGINAPLGIYYWVVRYTTFKQEQKVLKGWVEVLK
jgi:gliding motility-associated-like protein